MNKTLESWKYLDPADVAERIELQENYQASKQAQEVSDRLAKKAERDRIRALVFRKGGER